MASNEPTHFKYTCRKCGKLILVPISPDGPLATPHPSCCHSKKNPAYQGVVTQ